MPWSGICSRYVRVLTLVPLALLVLLPGAEAQDRASVAGRPVTAQTQRVRLPQDTQLDEGKALYEEHCQGCHGKEGQGRYGTDLAAVLISVDPQAHARASISMGVPGSTMPGWSSRVKGPFSDAELDAVAAYVVALARQRQAMIVPNAAVRRPLRDVLAPALLLALVAGGVGFALLSRRRVSI